MNYIDDISNIYLNLLEEGIEEKIPKLLGFVSDDIEDKEGYIRWAAETFDPTKNSSYITWILRLLKKGILAGEEDGDKVKERLTKFEELKKKPQFPKERRDINSYKTYGDLAETLDEFEGIKTKGEKRRELREEGIQYMGSSTGVEGKGICLYIVTTSEAGAKHFRGTDWCVKDPRHFDNYGAPYYYFTSNGSQSTLLHLNSQQCMDVRDRPTDLDDEEKALMETEEVTKYVLANDNSEAAISFYVEKVGGGHDDEISTMVWNNIETVISDGNAKLKIFNISEPYDDELSYYTPEAWGSIEYDFSIFKDYINDREFLKVVEDVLSFSDIYPEDFKYGDPIQSEDLNRVNFTIRYESSAYSREGIIRQLEDFINDLETIERGFDQEEFNEKMQELMKKAGYISSDYGNFTNKVDIRKLNLKNFGFNAGGECYVKTDIHFPVGRNNYNYTFNPNTNYAQTHSRDFHPFVAFSEFIKPLTNHGFTIILGIDKLELYFGQPYDEEKNQFEYLKEVKVLKNVDTHLSFYIDQIQKFLNNYVIPYFENFDDTGNYGIPKDLKIPIMKIKTRKESPNQQMLDLHEKTFAKSFFKKYGL
jgi:hypothetical protein